MQRPPVYLFAFANRQDAYLKNLQAEERAIRDSLSDLHDRRQIEFFSLGSASLDDIYRCFNRFHNRIAVFHYGGHSHADGLLLADHQARAANLATLMGMQDALQLVVLNGCANGKQVNGLLEAGVKTVIGTSREIGDRQATLFASQFFAGLAKRKTIRQAFDGAIAYVSDLGEMEAEKVHRGPHLRRGSTNPWGLFFQDEHQAEWQVPEPKAQLASEEEAAFRKDIELDHPKVNESLILQLAKGMQTLHPSIGELLNTFQQARNQEHLLDLKEEVLRHFPSMLCRQLGGIFSLGARRLSRTRLRVLCDTYLAFCRLLAAIGLSDLWEAVSDEHLGSKPDFQIRPEYRKDLRKYLELSHEEAENFDYLWLLATVHRILHENQVEPFMHELGTFQQLLHEDKPLYDAYRFLEQELRQPLSAGEIHQDDIASLCLQAEQHLGLLLSKCAFLSTYEIATIRDIRIRKHRREVQPAFLHDSALLRGSGDKARSIIPLERPLYSENQSVVVSKRLSSPEKTHNLMPFLIDIHSFTLKKGSEPDIHFLLGRNADGKLCYQRAKKMDDIFCVEQESDAGTSTHDFFFTYHGMDLLYQLLDDFSASLKVV